MARGFPQRRVILLLVLALLALAVLLLWRGEAEDLSLEPGPGPKAADEPEGELSGSPALLAADGASPRARTEAPTGGSTTPEATSASGASAPQSIAKPKDPGLLQLRVDVVHALTGADTHARWNLYPLPLDASGRPAPIAQDIERASPQKRRDWETEMVAWRRELLPSGSVRKVARKDPWTAPPVVLEGAPKDLVPWEAPESLRADVAADAQVLVTVMPVGPMAPLEVTLLEERRPLAGADRRKRQVRVEHLTVGEADWPLFELVEHSGVLLRILGIPHRPGEPVTAHVAWLPRGAAKAAPAPTADRRPQPNLRTTIPELLPDGGHPWRTAVPNPEPPPTPALEREPEGELVAPEPAGGNPDAPCELRLRVHGHDGRRLAPSDLEGQTLDDEGRIVQKDVPSGEYDLRLTLPGRLPIEKRLALQAGAVTDVVLHEPHGAELEVFVVDDLGQVRPTATLALPGRRWFDTDGPTQRIDLLTDHLGRRRIARVEPGPMIVHARWGSRRGSVVVNLEEDHLTRVTIVAR